MQVFITDQTKNLFTYLEYFEKKSTVEFEKDKLIEKKTVAQLTITSEPDLSFFWNYDIFPIKLMSYLTQWQHEKRKIRTGDIIIQQIFLPPFTPFSLKFIFGVRITNFYETENLNSFTYRTFEGHAEIGEASFTLEKTSPLNMTFTIHTYSKPNNIIPGITHKSISLFYQAFCTRMAIKNVKEIITSK